MPDQRPTGRTLLRLLPPQPHRRQPVQIAWKTQSGVTFSNVSRPASRNTARISPWVKLSAGSLFAVPRQEGSPFCATPTVSSQPSKCNITCNFPKIGDGKHWHLRTRFLDSRIKATILMRYLAGTNGKPRLLAGAGLSFARFCGSQRLASAATTARPAISSVGTV